MQAIELSITISAQGGNRRERQANLCQALAAAVNQMSAAILPASTPSSDGGHLSARSQVSGQIGR
jgi:hypothetical protein